jgi:hypothetical protein
MSGAGEVSIQPGQVTFANPNVGQSYSGYPMPGVPNGPPAVGGAPTCQNLLSDSPPTLLEAFDIYGFTISAVIQNTTSGAPPNMELVLDLMRNESLAATFTADPPAVAIASLSGEYVGLNVFTSDLTNPIRFGARDRLGLRLRGQLDQTAATLSLSVGVTYNPVIPGYVGQESKLFYNVVDLPASRRI